MSVTTIENTATTSVAAHGNALEPVEWAAPAVALQQRPKGAVRRTCERGMVTAEYAVGILAAIALAMVLVNVFKDDTFKGEMLAQVTSLIGQIGAQIK